MKSIAAVAFIVAFVVAEPPSNSYLPPSNHANAGYTANQNSLPQVVAARSQVQGFGRSDHGASGHGAAANGFARNSLQAGVHGAFGAQGHARAQPRFNQGGYGEEQGYDQTANLARNALEESNQEPANYNFGYMVNDYQEGTDFGHHEERQEERAQGEYHVVLPDGRKQTVSYEADEHGFKPQISYEDTDSLARSGYDSNANNFRSNNGYPGNEHGNHGQEQGPHGQEPGHHGQERGLLGQEQGPHIDHNGGYNQNGGHSGGRNTGY